MQYISKWVRFIALIMIVLTFCQTTAYAEEVGTEALSGVRRLDMTLNKDDLTEEPTETVEELSGIVMDANGKLWYMPQQIPLTFLTAEEVDLIHDGKLYTETELVIEDLRTNAEIVWDYFYYKFENAYGVGGLMGNIQVESGFNPANLQGTYERRFGMTDESYTAGVDNGTYENFIHDSAGYGLVQWTYWGLKRDLYNWAKESNQSIGDIYMQCDFLYHQFTTRYDFVGREISAARNVKSASNCVLLRFERPSDMSETAQNRRAGFGQNWYNTMQPRCQIIDAIRSDVQQQLERGRDKIVLLDLQYNLNTMWFGFLGKFYSFGNVTPADALAKAWEEFRPFA